MKKKVWEMTQARDPAMIEKLLVSGWEPYCVLDDDPYHSLVYFKRLRNR